MIQLTDVREPTIDNWYDCGKLVCKCVLDYHGIDQSYANRIIPTPTSGTPPIQLEHAFKLAGLLVAQGSWSFETIKRLRDPFIAYINAYDGIDHYVVVRGIQRNRVYVFCPEDGLISYPIPQFLSQWHSVTGNTPIKNGGMLCQQYPVEK
jgi:ABC-type bacteriocin/lantibiotic exporter with double-glycine peptidase domain